ncbi:MAG: zinc ribbon domain-containing protein [Gemmatimonadetes bacterium]|nr:zinc ribbon domain-containing protein [Gemmatimonadota bacterium]NNM05912.1 zinc ribbon domain-containing protein [Gemmatimonadota bacterium]
MPRYDYRCPDCDHAFLVSMSMSEYSEGNTPACPECGSENAERSFTSVGVLVGSRTTSSAPPAGGGGCGHSGFS